MAIPKQEEKASSRSPGQKDLITLSNIKNGETYKFSCKTCIDGHRAPLCDPKKHRGKVLFRRPNPGRPARQCGHPKAANCDCLAKRTLCCILSNDEWDQVCEGRTIAVYMFDSQDDLEDSQRAKNRAALHAMAPTPASTQSLNFQMFNGGGPQGNVHPRPDLFNWQGPAPQALPSLFTGSNSMSHNSILNPARELQQLEFEGVMSPHTRPVHANSHGHTLEGSQPGHMHAPWSSQPMNRPTYATEDPTSSAAGMLNTPIDMMDNNHMQLDHYVPTFPEQQFLPLETPDIPGNLISPFLNPPTTAPQAYDDHVLNMNMPIRGPQSTFTPQQMPPEPRKTSQCCSKTEQTPVSQPAFGTYRFPSSTPSTQFPCPSCASTECTCTNCPPTMQYGYGTGGAWAQTCGRRGHRIDSGLADNKLIDQAYSQPQQDCCSGGSTQAMPYAQAETGASDWGNFQEYPNMSNNDSITVDPAILQMPNWQE